MPLRRGLCLWAGLQVPRVHVLRESAGQVLRGGEAGRVQVSLRPELCLRAGLQVPGLRVLCQGQVERESSGQVLCGAG